VTTTIGARVRRTEDRRLLTGRGRYVDDVHVEGLLHAAIVRSPHAHARIRAIDARAARRLPGVVAVLTARDLPECAAGVPPLVPSAAMRAYHHAAIADAVARHAGEAVAVVIADDAYHAADGADAVRVTWEPRPAAASVERALAPGAPRVFDDWPDNVAGVARSAVGDVARGFAEADVVVEAALDFPRVAGVRSSRAASSRIRRRRTASSPCGPRRRSPTPCAAPSPPRSGSASRACACWRPTSAAASASRATRTPRRC